jgi:mono/diheme cytochrome c family protein
MSYREEDPELEQSTTRVMLLGAGVMLAMALAFPIYRLWFEVPTREDRYEDQMESLAVMGEEEYSLNCVSCHGLNGEGGIGPALNSQQFLQASTDDQTELLISIGVPGSQMGAYSQDHGGSLTSEQIKSLVTFIRSWEPDAPDVPDWREGQIGNETTGEEDAADTDEAAAGDDADEAVTDEDAEDAAGGDAEEAATDEG